MELARISTTCRSRWPRSIGVEGRAGYYDKAGALRDMVQNHLLQLLCLVAMEPPASLDANAVRDEKLKVLRSLKPIDDGQTSTQLTVRGQYRAGASAGGAGHRLSRGDSTARTATPKPSSRIKAEIDNWRWAGVPFYLRTGKRLANAGVGDRHRSSSRSRTRSSAGSAGSDARPTGW